MVQGAYVRARAILTGYEHELHALAKALIDNETLTGDQIKALLADLKGKVANASDAGKAGAPQP